MKYKIAICDDSEADRQYIGNMVERWASSAGHVVQIDSFPSAENFLFHYAEECDYDILLLDVEMGEMDGVTMAKKLRQSNDTVQIIFITGYSDYISEGYEVAALHYLMKPLKSEKLFEVLVTAEEMMRAEDLPGFFRIPADNRDLNYDNYFSKGNPEFGKIEQYTSHNTHRLNVEEMKQLLLKLKLFGGTC